MFRSINSKILSAQLLIAFIALFSLGTVGYLTTIPYISSIHHEKNDFIATTWSNNIASLLTDRKETITNIANSEVIEAYSYNFGAGLLSHYLANFQNKFPAIAYLNEEGLEEIKIVNGNKVKGGTHSSAATIRARQTPNQTVVELINTKPEPSQPASIFKLPYLEFAIYSQNFGEFNGLIVGQLPIATDVPEFAELTSFRFSKTGFLSLYDTKGNTLLTHIPSYILQKITLPDSINDVISSDHNNSAYQRNTINNIDSFSTYVPVPKSPMIVSATIPYDQFQKTPHRLKLLFVTLIFIIAIVCILISIAISRNIARPIMSLSKAASQLAKGQWEEKIDIGGSNETTILGHSFQQMSHHIHKMIQSRDNEIELRKKVEQAIKLSHLELDQIFNNAAGGKLVINLSHKVLRVNDTFLSMMGYERHEVIGENCHDLAPDVCCGTDQCIMEQVLERNGEVIQEVKKTRKDGTPLICTLVAVPFYGRSGDLIGIIEDFRDITRTKKAEELLKISESRYRLLFDSAPDGVAVLNDQGVIIDCNHSLAKIHGRRRADIIGHHFTKYNTPESKIACHGYFHNLQESTKEEGEVELLLPDDQIVIIWRKGTTIRDKQGYFTGVLIYDRDITKQKKTEELQDDMARIARHDLKTPLNGIINLPTLIKMDANLSETQIKRLNLIEDAGYKILQMINASLDLYKMEQGTYEFAAITVDICAIISKIKDDLWSEMQAKQNSITILLNSQPIKEGSVFLVLGEELLCYSMLANIVKNAVESSPKAKKITIALEVGQESIIKIHNFGPVPADFQSKFFEKYSTAGKSGGTGLGTYSARLMARTQGGEISLQSSSESGTTLTITLPATIPPPKISPKKAAEGAIKPHETSTQQYHILLAEDDPINQALATALLQEKEAFKVTAVDNGREAIEATETTKFDLILMDMQMPQVDGLEATRQIRCREKSLNQPEVPIIAITGMVGEANSDIFFAAGVNDFIAKPIQIGLLWQTISKYIELT